MRILRADSHRRMPWKNGGGETVEIAVWPPEAGLDDFDWRVSMAHVVQDGPFSSFPGIDRTLSLLEGQGIVLEVEGRASLDLTRLHEPVMFPADVPVTAKLIAGPIADLNVMSRRGRFEHSVRFVDISGEAEVEIRAASLILAVAGSSSFVAGAGRGRLAPYDGLLVDVPVAILLSAPGPATVAVIGFRPT